MTIGDGIAVAGGAIGMAGFFFALAWNNIRIAQIKLEAAKNGLRVTGS